MQQVAGHRVEGAERLVHQQHVRLLAERAGQRHPLAHPAGKLVRLPAAEPAEVHELKELGGALPALRPGNTGGPGQLDVAGRGEPGKRAGSWNMSATRLPFVDTSPAVGRSRPATRDSSVLLPQPEAPIRQTNSPAAADREMWSRATTVDAPLPNVLDTSAIWIAASGLALTGTAGTSSMVLR